MSLIPESAHQIGENPQLMGILSLPPENNEVRKTAVVILSSGLLHRSGPFRLHVDLARRLAESGFATLRLDQAGRGDSNRSEGLTSLETIQQEILTAQKLLQEKALAREIIVVGLCSGADDALELTGSCDDIMGLVLLDGFAARTWAYYLKYYSSRILDPLRLKAIIKNRILRFRTRMSVGPNSTDEKYIELGGIRKFPSLTDARAAFDKLFERDGAALCVFTGGIKDYYCSKGQLRENLGLKKTDDRLSEVFYPDANHTYPITAHREALVCLIAEWCNTTFK